MLIHCLEVMEHFVEFFLNLFDALCVQLRPRVLTSQSKYATKDTSLTEDLIEYIWDMRLGRVNFKLALDGLSSGRVFLAEATDSIA